MVGTHERLVGQVGLSSRLFPSLARLLDRSLARSIKAYSSLIKAYSRTSLVVELGKLYFDGVMVVVWCDPLG